MVLTFLRTMLKHFFLYDTHACTHEHTHTSTHTIHEHTHADMSIYTRAYTHTHAYTHACTYTQSHEPTHTCTHEHTCMRAHTCLCRHHPPFLACFPLQHFSLPARLWHYYIFYHGFFSVCLQCTGFRRQQCLFSLQHPKIIRHHIDFVNYRPT